MQKKEVITLGKVTGTFKDDNFTIQIGPMWYDCKLLCNGQELTSIQSCVIVLEAGKPTRVHIKKICLRKIDKTPVKTFDMPHVKPSTSKPEKGKE